jgi:hypothetical protein
MRYPQNRRVIYVQAPKKKGHGPAYNALALIILALLLFGLIVVAGNVAKQQRLAQEKYSDSP